MDLVMVMVEWTNISTCRRQSLVVMYFTSFKRSGTNRPVIREVKRTVQPHRMVAAPAIKGRDWLPRCPGHPDCAMATHMEYWRKYARHARTDSKIQTTSTAAVSWIKAQMLWILEDGRSCLGLRLLQWRRTVILTFIGLNVGTVVRAT